MDKFVLVKSNTRPSVYRSLNIISPKLFPINYQRNHNKITMNKVLTRIAKTGLSGEQIMSEMEMAILGQSSEFSDLIGGSTIAEDHSDNLYVGVFIFGFLLAYVFFKAFTIRKW